LPSAKPLCGDASEAILSLWGPSGGRGGIDVQPVLFEAADMPIGKIAAFPFEDGFVSGFGGCGECPAFFDGLVGGKGGLTLGWTKVLMCEME
jgi:hypothetical protein